MGIVKSFESKMSKKIDKLIVSARRDERLKIKIALIGIFYLVLKDLYGKEIANIVIQKVNSLEKKI